MTLIAARTPVTQRPTPSRSEETLSPKPAPAAPARVAGSDSFHVLDSRPASSVGGNIRMPSLAELRSARTTNRPEAVEVACTGAIPVDQLPGMVDEIAGMKDPVLRNYRITQAYHDMSERMGKILGSSEANWCTFATWASRQAGQSIRKEDLPELVRDIAHGPIPGLGLVYDVATEHVSGQIGRGNHQVFQDIAPAYARFIATFEGRDTPDPARLESFLATLRPGPVEQGGQDLLRDAFKSYYAAKFETDPDRKSERILLGNLLIGLHEQTGLQPVIEDTMPFGSSKLLTPMMMELKLPDETLRMGEDLPQRGAMFPTTLRTIENPELRAVLARLDRMPGTTEGSAASDWTKLDDRMNYIVDLFRSRQQDRSLFGQPLNLQERARVRATGYDRVGVA